MHTLSLPPLAVTILEGDITSRSVEAIVNAANNAFWMGGGVAGAIKAKGGQEIEREAMSQGPVEPGRSVITSAGRLPAKHVIHAAVMGQDLRTDAQLISASTSSALELASTRGLTSVAFPALGTGVGGFPVAECARVMLQALRRHIEQDRRTSLRSIEFVLFGANAYDEFRRAAAATIENQ